MVIIILCIIYATFRFYFVHREGVMEFLLANHPLDCPICDQGGECDLQVPLILTNVKCFDTRSEGIVGQRRC